MQKLLGNIRESGRSSNNLVVIHFDMQISKVNGLCLGYIMNREDVYCPEELGSLITMIAKEV